MVVALALVIHDRAHFHPQHVRLPVRFAVLTPRVAFLVVEDDDWDGELCGDALATSTDPRHLFLCLAQRSSHVGVEQLDPLHIVKYQHVRTFCNACMDRLVVERSENVDVRAERARP